MYLQISRTELLRTFKTHVWKAFHNITAKLQRRPQWSLGNRPQSSFSNPRRSKLWGIIWLPSAAGLKNIRSKRCLLIAGIPRLEFICVSHVYWQCLGLPKNSQTSKMLLGKPPHLVTWKEGKLWDSQTFSPYLKNCVFTITSKCNISNQNITIYLLKHKCKTRYLTTKYKVYFAALLVSIGNIKISREPERSGICLFIKR